ncbi:oligoendopeptidase F [Rossellomorea marisflavi]
MMDEWTLHPLIPDDVDLDIARITSELERVTKNGVLSEKILTLQEIYSRCYEYLELAVCITWKDKKDSMGKQLAGQAEELMGRYKQIESEVKQECRQLADDEWSRLADSEELVSLWPVLSTWRLPSPGSHELEADGLHAWAELYGMASEQVKPRWEGKEIPLGEAVRLVYYSNDRAMRIEFFEEWTKEWENVSHWCAKALNHISGFRISRGEDPIQSAYETNRITEQSVNDMWTSVLERKGMFHDFLQHKLTLQGGKDLHWTDQFAPLPLQTELGTIHYEKAKVLIRDLIGAFSEDAGLFVQQAFHHKWVDAAPSRHKVVSAFCAHFPTERQTRVMMSYEDDLQSVSVLAHELGHAYHYHLLQDQPMFLQDCPQAFTEIASTLFESILMEEAMKSASPLEKIYLLDQQISRDIGTILNSCVRHQFEEKLYENRHMGAVDASMLNRWMADVQKHVFGPELKTVDPTFWASLRHFYITRKPFGHFPYTVAHLLSTGIYHQVKDAEDKEQRLIAMLKDTTSLTVDEFIEKHLTSECIWESALDRIQANIETFIALSSR